MVTINELQAEINALMAQLGVLQGGDPTPTPFVVEEENSQIERYLSEFTQREGVLLTIATLLTLLPLFDDKGVVAYFLIWVIPFLVISIFFYVCSTKRINFLPSLRIKAGLPTMAPWEINELLVKTYLRARKFHHLTDSILVTFFISFILNYYFYFFTGIPTLKNSIFILITAIIVGFIRFKFISTMKTDNPTHDPGTLAVGVAPPDA